MNDQFGVDYYPEQWPEERWPEDARLMAEMGLRVVRLAEFAWAKLEPAPGRFEFAWLERAIAVLSSRGLRVVLGTPTAAPPAWLVTKYPNALPVDSQGRRHSFGGRHHCCHSHPAYRKHSRRIVAALGRRFGNHEAVAGWQIDNELGNSQEDFCHCDSCRRGFQAWLKRRYGSLEALNRRWGTVFWSQTYTSFAQIPTPRLNPNSHSPSLRLDWKRFRSDLLADFLDEQGGLLRSLSPGRFATHNLMGFFDHPDAFRLGKNLDFVSHDQYPFGFWEPAKTPAVLAATLDLVAGIKRRPFWVMEQQAGISGWDIQGEAPRPGQLALWAAQSVAHGADTVLFFRWRTGLCGTEQFWHGILPHNGVPGRRYQELYGLIQTLSPLMPRFEGALSGAEVGLLFSYEQNWALQIQPHHPELDYVSVVQSLHAAFWRRQVPVDFVGPEVELSGYRLVVAPLLLLDLPGVAERLHRYVGQGGTVLLTFRSGLKNQDNVVRTPEPLPGPYGELLGIQVLDYSALIGAGVPIKGTESQGTLWWDEVTLKGATAVFEAEGERAGQALVSHRQAGPGHAYYLASVPDSGLLDELAALFIERSGVQPLGTAPEGVELVRRRTPESDYLFVLNHADEPKSYSPGSDWEPLHGGPSLLPFGFHLYTRKK